MMEEYRIPQCTHCGGEAVGFYQGDPVCNWCRRARETRRERVLRVLKQVPWEEVVVSVAVTVITGGILGRLR